MDDIDYNRMQHRLAELPVWQRQPVGDIARTLFKLRAYKGSSTDAVTDALSLLLPIWHLLPEAPVA